jgi:hypothetical protein
MNTIASQIKQEADKTMRELEQSGLAPFQIDRLSGKVNGLMLAYEIAQTAKREPLADAQIVNCYESALSQALRSQDRYGVVSFCRAIEAAHGITKETP